MRAPSLVLVAAALWGACGRDPENLLTSHSCKPEPPIVVELTSQVLGPQRYELTATATPTAAVDRIELMIGRGGKRSFGATARGEARVLTAIVETTDRTTELFARAQVPVEGVEMVKTALLTVGEPRPQSKTKQYATPDGELAREVRP